MASREYVRSVFCASLLWDALTKQVETDADKFELRMYHYAGLGVQTKLPNVLLQGIVG